jgi:hypothetical protein
VLCRGTKVAEKKIATAELKAKARVLWRQILGADGLDEQEV